MAEENFRARTRAWFTDIPEWLWSVAVRWSTLVGGGIVSMALYLWDRSSHDSAHLFSLTGLFWIMAGAFVASSYDAWHKERRGRLALESPPPSFFGEISMVSTFDVNQPGMTAFLHPYSHAMLASGWIRNDGGPSYIRSWTASAIDDTTGVKVKGHVMYPPKTTLSYTALDQRGQSITVEYNEANSLLRRSGSTMQRYNRESGVIVVGFDRRVNPASLRLGFDDRNETWYGIGVIERAEAPMP